MSCDALVSLVKLLHSREQPQYNDGHSLCQNIPFVINGKTFIHSSRIYTNNGLICCSFLEYLPQITLQQKQKEEKKSLHLTVALSMNFSSSTFAASIITSKKSSVCLIFDKAS